MGFEVQMASGGVGCAAVAQPVALPPAELRRGLEAVGKTLSRTLDALDAALAQLQGPAASVWQAPPAGSTENSGGCTFSPSSSSSSPAPPVPLETSVVHEQLRRLHAHFSDASRVSAPPCLSGFGFVRMLRAARLLGAVCSQVEADLIFCRVVKSRNGRMGLAHMISALSMVALRHFPTERTQPAAFHRLMSSHLLSWMLHYDFELTVAALRHSQVAPILERHAPLLDRYFDLYLCCPAKPVIPAVAAMPEPMLQWPQLVAFAQEFEICPALLSWSKLSRMVCFTGSCAISHRWQAPESHGITRECVPQHIIPSTALPTAVAMVVP